MQTGFADLPLHSGHTPRWLFERMVKLSRAISEIIIFEFGKDEFLRRISDPFFFQSFSCALGFDWHSSGTTTTTMGALKTAKLEDFGIAILGGKGKASRKTPEEIAKLGEKFSLPEKNLNGLKYASKISAKVDNACVQDNFQLYHHSFVVSEDGNWSVVQQGMNSETKYARRYHWLSEKISSFVIEPHAAICCDTRGKTLNMVAEENSDARKCSVDLVKDNPKNLLKYLRMPEFHEIDLKNYKTLMNAYEMQPKNFEELIAIKGVGAKNIRALALLSNLIFGAEISWRDPAKFSFAHGGKDGTPYPIDRESYHKSVEIISDAIRQAKINEFEKMKALRRIGEGIRIY